VAFGLKLIGKPLSARFRRMAKELPLIVDDELHEVATDMIEDFEKTTATWNHKPVFAAQKISGGWVVGTSDDIWNWADQGVPEHTIVPVSAPSLVFNTPFRAKTKAHTISSYAGYVGPNVVRAQSVTVGIEAREFTETIIKRWQPRVSKRVRARLAEGIEAIGI
jgi:hypothetical protein